MRALVVAGTQSGVGKTTLAMGLLAGLRERGVRVRSFKAGPDFIDAAHLARAAHCECLNLDTWLLGLDLCHERLGEAAAACDFALIEGMMGLFDGRSGGSEEGSTAELAKALGLPVVLVVDASAGVRSLAAMVLGFQRFDAELNLAGVIFNRVGGVAHLAMLREAMQAVPEVTVLGGFPSDDRALIPERHLGLSLENFTALPQGWAAEHVDLDRLMALGAEVAPLQRPRQSIGIRERTSWDSGGPRPARATNKRAAERSAAGCPRPSRVGVARDAAFCFYYPDNLAALRAAGIELIEFSPLRDVALPPGIKGLYLGGGYPELHARELSANLEMRNAVRAFAQGGGFIYAECGGLMYLAQELDGAAMAGVLPCTVRMQKRPAALGYREVIPVALLGEDAPRVRGHEFHYSRLQKDGACAPAHLAIAPDRSLVPEGFHLGNVVASYIHLHFASCPEFAQRLALS